MNYSLLIAIENYYDKKIEKVDYAENDLKELHNALEIIGYTKADSIILLNNSSTKPMIESKIRKLCGLVQKNDKIAFYYADHGFANNGQNYITCYDSIVDDLVPTSIQIQDIFSQLSKACDNVIFFFDSCHSGLQIDTKMRGLYSDMNKNELIEAIKNKTYCIGFAACKNNESSYPITALKHGAWTYHLIESLNGMAPDALEKGSLLTANSLQAYLSRAVPLSLKKAYTVSKTQTQWIFGGYETDILLGDLTTVIKKNKAPLPSVQAIELETTSFGSIKSLS